MKIKSWSIISFISIVILGTLLHYVYEWTGYNYYIGALVPVNEAVWEHLKLGHLSIILFSIPEYFFINKKVNNFFLAKALGSVSLALTILIIFYTYSSILGDTLVAIDIASYVIGALVSQIIIHKFYFKPKVKNSTNRMGLLFMIGLTILFAVFTYEPPNYRIFMDNNDNTYGIKNI